MHCTCHPPWPTIKFPFKSHQIPPKVIEEAINEVMTQYSQGTKCLSYIFKWLLISELVQNTLTFKVNQINQENDSQQQSCFWWYCFQIQLMCGDVAVALVLSATIHYGGPKLQQARVGAVVWGLFSFQVTQLHWETGYTNLNIPSRPYLVPFALVSSQVGVPAQSLPKNRRKQEVTPFLKIYQSNSSLKVPK